MRKDIDPHSHIEVLVSGVPDDQGVPAPEAAEFTNDGNTTYSHAHWQCSMTGKIDLLELFAGSARVSQCAALVGLRVGAPVGLRTGFDLSSRSGQQRAMQMILEQKPKVIHMAPLCSPWSLWSNMKTEKGKMEDRRRVMPMVRFCAQVAMHQIKHGRKFIIENPRENPLCGMSIVSRTCSVSAGLHMAI